MTSAYLEALAARASTEIEAVILWPRTPIGDEIQERIRDRVGVDDNAVADARSRPARIVAALERLTRDETISSDFSLLDIACGDALVLTAIAERFPDAHCHGLDINVDRFPAHARAREAGVALYAIPIQELVASRPEVPFDVAMMLNTYRGWESADLRDSEHDLPGLVESWLSSSARVLVLTARIGQLESWERRGYAVEDLGRGEDDSRLVVLRGSAGDRPGPGGV